MNEKLAAVEFAASNGMVFVEDADRPLSAEIGPSGEPVEPDPARSVSVGVVHAMDGLVSVEVLEGEGKPDGLVEFFDGTLNFQHGRLRVRDVPGDNFVTIGLSPGPCRVRIYVEQTEIPGFVTVLVPPL
ncbi:hypothetical protein [Streptomyces jumonjinensis]|uniref:Uncharacterized protein n=1 Tax=Streptomyces jumonjinensis TaxID=1945 RepID=A0A646KEJ9_STRJU|nr:hypothetical protein [Streptomyces jumonjinensis]MQT00653.1 hypothetical protein [Streptomyces jumonjinensis]